MDLHPHEKGMSICVWECDWNPIGLLLSFNQTECLRQCVCVSVSRFYLFTSGIPLPNIAIVEQVNKSDPSSLLDPSSLANQNCCTFNPINLRLSRQTKSLSTKTEHTVSFFRVRKNDMAPLNWHTNTNQRIEQISIFSSLQLSAKNAYISSHI